MENAGSFRPVRPRFAPFFLSAAVCALAVAASYLFFVRTTTGQYIDETAWSEAKPAQQHLDAPLRAFLDQLPLLCAVVGVVLVLVIALRARRWASAAITLFGMVLANVATQLIKVSLQRPSRGVPTFDFNSLPSGHTTVAASAAAAVFLISSPRWRPLAGFLGGSFAVLTGCALLIDRWHRPADVVAGFLVVACLACLTGWLVCSVGGSWNRLTDSDSRFWAASRFWPVLCALLGFAAAAVAVVVTAKLGEPGVQRSISYLVSGLALIVLSGYALSVAGTLLFGMESRRAGRHEPEQALGPGEAG